MVCYYVIDYPEKPHKYFFPLVVKWSSQCGFFCVFFSQEVLTAFPCQLGKVVETVFPFTVEKHCLWYLQLDHLTETQMSWLVLWFWKSSCSVRCQYVTSHWMGISSGYQFLVWKTCHLFVRSFFDWIFHFFCDSSPTIKLANFSCHLCKQMHAIIRWQLI